MRLTVEFNLAQYIHSDTAIRLGIAAQDNPPPEVVERLKDLHESITIPLIGALPCGYLNISSGWRCLELNRKVGSKDNSQHVLGEAMDIQYFDNYGKMDNSMILKLANNCNLNWDQAINEHGFSWVHLSYHTEHNRHQFLTIG